MPALPSYHPPVLPLPPLPPFLRAVLPQRVRQGSHAAAVVRWCAASRTFVMLYLVLSVDAKC